MQWGPTLEKTNTEELETNEKNKETIWTLNGIESKTCGQVQVESIQAHGEVSNNIVHNNSRQALESIFHRTVLANINRRRGEDNAEIQIGQNHGIDRDFSRNQPVKQEKSVLSTSANEELSGKHPEHEVWSFQSCEDNAVSTTEAKYVALTRSLGKVIITVTTKSDDGSDRQTQTNNNVASCYQASIQQVISSNIDEETFDAYCAAEFKRGYVAQLGALGYIIVPEIFRFTGDISPGLAFANVPNGVDVIDATPALGWDQINFFNGAVPYGGELGDSDTSKPAKDGEDPPSGSQDGTALSLEVIIEMTPSPRSTVYADATLGANDGTAPAQGAGTVNDDQLQAINAAVAAALANAQGIKILVAAIVPLTNKYDRTSANMHMFLKDVKGRGQSIGWSNILNIPNEDGASRNILDWYGVITLEHIKAHALTYENAKLRDAQNSSQLYEFLYASISDETKLNVLSDASDYTINLVDGTTATNDDMFLKVIIRNTTVDTRSTVFHIRENLNSQESYMASVKYDIEGFNQYVKAQMEALAARGESSSNLLILLFSAYMVVPDKKFVEYIEKQKDKYDEGDKVTVKSLMQVALIKYKDRVRS